MSLNPMSAPRERKCRVCELVATPDDVTIRLYSPELEHLPLEGAVEYLRAVGLAGTPRQLQAIAIGHRRHIDKFIARSGAVAPAQGTDDGVVRIPPRLGPARWVDVNQRGMDLGASAAAILEDRMRIPGALETKDLISIATLGQTAASKRADLEMKGQLRRAEALAQIASGFKKPEEASA